MTPFLVERWGDKLATTALEVQLSDVNGKYMLPDDSILRNKTVVGVLTTGNPSGNAKSPMGRDLVSDAALQSSFITLKKGNDEIIEDHPVTDFLRSEYDCCLRLLEFCGFSPSKSFITVTNTSLISAGESIMLHFVYVKE